MCHLAWLTLLQQIDKLNRGDEAYALAMCTDGLDAQTDRQVRLTCAQSADEHHVVGRVQELHLEQFAHQSFVQVGMLELETDKVAVRGELRQAHLVFALATSASWTRYFRALQLGNASPVGSVDKFSLVPVAVFSFAFQGERPSLRE